MSMVHEIAAATAGDSSEINRLLTVAGLPVEDLKADLLQHFLVARRGKRLDGAIGLEVYGVIGLLRSLVVARGSRGTGLGRRLVKELEAKARDIGVGELWLLTIDADPFFESLGYRISARSEAPAAIAATREFTELCPDNAVLMRKQLSASDGVGLQA